MEEIVLPKEERGWWQRNFFKSKRTHLIVITGISTFSRLIVTISSVTFKEITTLTLKSVDATLQVDVQTRIVVDCERSLGGHVSIFRIDGILKAFLVNIEKTCKIDVVFGYRDFIQRRAVNAIFRSKT